MGKLMRRIHLKTAPQDHAANGDRPAIDPVRLGAYVRQLRERRGWRQADLAKKARVAPNTVTGLEAGRRTQKVNVDKIAAVLGTSGDALRRGEFTDDAEFVLRELSAEDIAIARKFHHATTGEREAVYLILHSGRRDLTERLLHLDPERQAHLLRILNAEEREQRERDVERTRTPRQANGSGS